MSKAASLTSLEKLHAALANKLATELEENEVSPQLLAQVIKFLKDNGIEPARDSNNNALDALAAKVASLTEDDLSGIDDFLN